MTMKIIFIIWRYYKMSRNAMNVAKGIGAGMVAGVMVGFVGSQMMKNEKKMKKKAGKAFSAVGDLIENAQYMFK